MATLAELVMAQDEQFRREFVSSEDGAARLDKIPRITVNKETYDSCVGLVNDWVSSACISLLFNDRVSGLFDILGADSIWIETSFYIPMDDDIVYRPGWLISKSSNGGVHLSCVGGAKYHPFPGFTTTGEFVVPHVVGHAPSNWQPERTPEGWKFQAEFDHVPFVTADEARLHFFQAAAVAFGLAQLLTTDTPAELAPRDPAEERRIRQVNRGRRAMRRPLALPCRPIVWNINKVPTWEAEQRVRLEARARAEARPHAVRGHFRHYRSGRVSQVRPHFRCGVPEHMGRDYVVRA